MAARSLPKSSPYGGQEIGRAREKRTALQTCLWWESGRRVGLVIDLATLMQIPRAPALCYQREGSFFRSTSADTGVRGFTALRAL